MRLWDNNRAITDEALLLLLAAIRDFESAVCAPQRRPRIVSSSFGTYDPVQIQYQAIILRQVSTIEAYIDTLNRELLREGIPWPAPMLASILQEVEFWSSRSWREREQWFKRIHGIRLSYQDRDAWKKVEAARDARNAIAHGLGRLTPRQLRSTNIAERLYRIRIHISNGQMVIAPESMSIVADACSTFVRSLDAAANLPAPRPGK